jgi:hypothetical protein
MTVPDRLEPSQEPTGYPTGTRTERRRLTSPSTNNGRDNTLRQQLYAAILAQACNFGITAMAEACGLTYDMLAWTNQWYLREETLRPAGAAIESGTSGGGRAVLAGHELVRADGPGRVERCGSGGHCERLPPLVPGFTTHPINKPGRVASPTLFRSPNWAGDSPFRILFRSSSQARSAAAPGGRSHVSAA